jgi:rubredoxin
MNSGMFENSHDGDARHLHPDDKLECGICWWVYDPAVGDAAGGIPPGTPFPALPEHWECPECGALRHKFMVIKA